ncbi:MAG: hypothetical protein ACFFAT_17860 [Promethearchaeota archaeon]
MEVIQIDKDYVRDILDEYKRAIDILGLAEILPLEDHKQKIDRIKKLEQSIFKQLKTIIEIV